MNIGSVLAQLREERSRTQKELGRLDEAISALQKLAVDQPEGNHTSPVRVRRKLSAAARRKISLAQKERWAKLKKRKAAG